MKANRKLCNNRGAALVTVLIATTFMTLIAASLIYMAYMNYLTKAMRYYTTDTFYTDEYALDELSTTLQEIAADCSDIADAKDSIKSAVGEVTSPHHMYTPAAVQSLITLAAQDAAITVATSPRLCDDAGVPNQDTMKVDDNYIKLMGVQITATTAEGYTSTITADITIFFPNSAPGTMNINDFSIISESYIDMSNGGCRIYSGNMLVQNAAGPSHGANAININNYGTMTLLSPNAIIDGNVNIDGHSVMHITGDCIVYGSVTLSDKSTLIVSGQLRTTGGITKGSDCTVIGTSLAGQSVPRHTHLNSNILQSKLFEDVYVYGHPTSSSSAKDFRRTNLYDLCMLGSGNVQVKVDSTIGSGPSAQEVHAVVYGKGQGNNIHDAKNSLIMLCHDVNISANLKFENSTILTCGVISYNNTQGSAYMTKMDDEVYEAALDLLYNDSHDQIEMRIPEGGSAVNYKTGFVSGNKDMDDKDYMADHGGTQYPDPNGRENVIYVVDSSSMTNYLPVRYFISENASRILTDIFNEPNGTQDTKNSIIVYELWSKD